MAILIVDNCQDSAARIAGLLERWGYDPPVTASSAAAACSLLGAGGEAGEGIDLLLMNVFLDGEDGIEACRTIKASSGTGGTPVILFSAGGEEMARAFEAGADDCMGKAPTEAELVARVRNVLARHCEQRALRRLADMLTHSAQTLRYYEKAIQNMQIGLTISDIGGKILYVNPAEAAMHQYTPEELIGQNVRIFAPKKLWRPMEQKALKSAVSFSRETINLRKDGSTFPARLLSDVVLDDEGEPMAMVSTCEDITERKAAEEALKAAHDELERRVEERTAALARSEKEYRAISLQLNTLLDAIPDSLILFSPDLRVLWANRGAARIFGPDREAVVGEGCPVVSGLYDDPAAWPVRRCFESGREENDDVTSSEGQRFSIRAFPLLDEKGQTTSVLELLVDVTEKVHLQAEAMRAGHLASIGELSAGVAHEINNPVNAIINCAQLIMKRAKGEEKTEDLAGLIVKEGRRVATIVQALLSFARKQGERRGPVDLRAVLDDTMALTQAHLRKECIDLRIDFPSSLPAVLGNEQQIEQVFLNIINNARYALNEKYPGTDPLKRLEISARQVRVKRHPWMRIVFFDTGPGISDKIIGRIFDPFFSTKPPREGTGLGLSISHGIITDHGGRLDVESREGEFTRVTIDLPVHRGE